VEDIEAQLDTWMLVVANGLKAVPSLGDVMTSSLGLIGGPLAEELEVVLQEHRLGSPLNVAIRAMAIRVGSPVLTAAVTTLDVARRTGGALSETLEQAAASMREMARLQGVVRTKTAESKSQAWVISFVPAVLLAVLQKLCPDVIEALFITSRGHVVLVVAALLWVGAIVGAMRILQVDT
jgi:tight adherence protein B